MLKISTGSGNSSKGLITLKWRTTSLLHHPFFKKNIMKGYLYYMFSPKFILFIAINYHNVLVFIFFIYLSLINRKKLILVPKNRRRVVLITQKNSTFDSSKKETSLNKFNFH
jgi:hypothetical protein